MIDGQDIEDITLESLRNKISVVPQDTGRNYNTLSDISIQIYIFERIFFFIIKLCTYILLSMINIYILYTSIYFLVAILNKAYIYIIY